MTISKKYEYDFPMASITADVVIFREKSHNDFDVLLIKRGGEPYLDCLAIPGGFVNVQTEKVIHAAIREVSEEVGYKPNSGEMRFVGFFDNPNRDPRGRTISFAYYIVVPNSVKFVAGDDAKSLDWYDVKELHKNGTQLAFDHNTILFQAFLALNRNLI